MNLNRRNSLLAMAACLVLSVAMATPSLAATQVAGVDNSKMGAYRALTELTFQAFQKGDNATAAKLARILERTWDAAEEGGGDKSLVKLNKALFDEIDKSMDAFIKPILRYANKPPDPAAVQATYNAFLEELKKGDQ